MIACSGPGQRQNGRNGLCPGVVLEHIGAGARLVGGVDMERVGVRAQVEDLRVGHGASE